MTAQEKIAEELSVLGYLPQIVDSGIFVGEETVVFNFPVTTGRYRGNDYKIALSFQENGYPEYPPHFVWVSNIDNPNLPVHSTFSFDNSDWSSFSVPPSDFWDHLPYQDKNMKTYVNRHLTRFWGQI